MKKYDSYKDSGIEWIGEIPSHWDVTRIKYKFQIGRGRVISNEDLVEDGIYPVYSSQTLNNGCLGFIDTYDFDDKLITWTTDGANAGTVFLREGKFNCTNVCGTLKAKSDEIIPEYDYYFLQYATQFYKRPDTNGAKIMNNEMAVILSLKLSNEEQTAIANYLDQKTSQIDDLIAKKERLIQLLEEERTAIINHAVTKGLDPTVPMKDSGIEWLGEIPAHWFLVPVKRVIEVRDGTHDTPEYVQNELISYPLITSKDFDGEEINFSNAKMISESDHKAISKRSGVKSGDVLMSMIGGNIGKSLIIGNRDNFSIKNVALFMTRDNIFLAKYLRYYFDSGLLSKQIELKSRGGAQGFLSLGDIRNLIFFKFDSEELKIIIDYLDKKTTETSNVISKTQQEIELLKEYKTALISEVVTGKVDVRKEKWN